MIHNNFPSFGECSANLGKVNKIYLSIFAPYVIDNDYHLIFYFRQDLNAKKMLKSQIIYC